MKIPQSVFDGKDWCFMYAAANQGGAIYLYDSKPLAGGDAWQHAGRSEATEANVFDDAPPDVAVPYDWWQGTLIQRGAPVLQQAAPAPVPQIDLPQSVFNGAPAWVEWAQLVDRDLFWYAHKPDVPGPNPNRSQLAPPLLAPLQSYKAYGPTKRLQMPQAAIRQYGLPEPTVTTTKRITLELSDDQCEKLLIESIRRHFPQMAGGNLSLERNGTGCVVTAEVQL